MRICFPPIRASFSPRSGWIISIIQDQEVVKTILKHLSLLVIRSKSPPKSHAPPSSQYVANGTCQTSGHAQ